MLVDTAPQAFAPSAAPSPPVFRLRVVQDGAQDCSVCQNLNQCWKPKQVASAQKLIISNLLVCRLKRGIDVNRTTRAFLSLIQPGTRKIAKYVATRTNARFAQVVTELESIAIEAILTDYVMGEIISPLPWLFQHRRGCLRLWALRTVRAYERDQQRMVSYSRKTELVDGRTFESGNSRRQVSPENFIVRSPYDDPSDDRLMSDRCQHALELVEDGKTLTAAEYRAFRFCLKNARGPSATTTWLHRHLAESMGVLRKDVSRLHGIAVRKILEGTGYRDRYFKSRGVELPKTRRNSRNRPLTPDEIVAAVETLRTADGRATVLDLAWALNTTDATVHQLKRRFAGLSLAEVRERVTSGERETEE